jgi:integrase
MPIGSHEVTNAICAFNLRSSESWVAVRLTQAVDLFCADMWSSGRFTSPRTDENYRYTLVILAEQCGNRDPRTIGREDCKAVLRRWDNPNTQALHRAHLASFGDWLMEEGYRKDNPARQTRRPRVKKAQIYRLTREEAVALRLAAKPGREQRAIDLGLLAGLRAAELSGLQGRHFRRPGWVWVSADIAKGKRERWVPVLRELEQTWRQIARTVADDEYVLANARFTPKRAVGWKIDPSQPTPYSTLFRLVVEVGKRAEIHQRVHPHLLRHAFGDHIARFAGMREAQFVLGHAAVATTERYVGQPTLDEVAKSLRGFGYGQLPSRSGAASQPSERVAGLHP